MQWLTRYMLLIGPNIVIKNIRLVRIKKNKKNKKKSNTYDMNNEIVLMVYTTPIGLIFFFLATQT